MQYEEDRNPIKVEITGGKKIGVHEPTKLYEGNFFVNVPEGYVAELTLKKLEVEDNV